MIHVLLVEDEDPKLRHLRDRLSYELPEAIIDICRSVNSATDYLERSTPDIVILDMSLPTFDVTQTEGGGRPQGFGGVEVLRHIAFNDLACKVIVITGYRGVSERGCASQCNRSGGRTRWKSSPRRSPLYSD